MMEFLTTKPAIAIIFFVAGFISRGFVGKSMKMSDKSAKNFLSYVVVTVWALAVIASIINPSYEVPISMYGVLSIVAGFFSPWNPWADKGKK